MSEELSTYEKKRLELEKQKVELLRDIRKDLRHDRKLKNLYNVVDALEIDRDDIDRFVRFVGDQLEERRDNEDDE